MKVYVIKCGDDGLYFPRSRHTGRVTEIERAWYYLRKQDAKITLKNIRKYTFPGEFNRSNSDIIECDLQIKEI